MNTSFVPIISAVFVLLGAFDFFYCWKAAQKVTPTGKWISLSALAAGIITEAYLTSISSYSYRFASVAASVYFLMIDWMLIALVHFCYVFTDMQSSRRSRYIRHAIDLAEKMKQIFRAHGIPFYIDSPTNQQFVVLENERMQKLQAKIGFECWEKKDEAHTVVRFATSWSTTESDLAALDEALKES